MLHSHLSWVYPVCRQTRAVCKNDVQNVDYNVEPGELIGVDSEEAMT